MGDLGTTCRRGQQSGGPAPRGAQFVAPAGWSDSRCPAQRQLGDRERPGPVRAASTSTSAPARIREPEEENCELRRVNEVLKRHSHQSAGQGRQFATGVGIGDLKGGARCLVEGVGVEEPGLPVVPAKAPVAVNACSPTSPSLS